MGRPSSCPSLHGRHGHHHSHGSHSSHSSHHHGHGRHSQSSHSPHGHSSHSPHGHSPHSHAGHEQRKLRKHKYKPCKGYDQLQVALVGTCIASELPPGARSRSGRATRDDDDLAGIVADIHTMYAYFHDHGAAVKEMICNTHKVTDDEIKQTIKDFVQSEGNNKFLYLSGHGDKKGRFVCNGGYLDPVVLLDWLAEAHFVGQLTVMVDACYSGQWSRRLWRAVEEGRYDGMMDDAAAARCKTNINLLLSSLPFETSSDCGARTGGLYTSEWAKRKEEEWRHASPSAGPGWGTRVLRQDPARAAVFSCYEDEEQTDLPFNLIITVDGIEYDVAPNRQKYMR